MVFVRFLFQGDEELQYQAHGESKCLISATFDYNRNVKCLLAQILDFNN